MEKDYLKEKIGLLKDWMKGLFALFVLIGSGTMGIFINRSFLTSTFYRDVMITGACSDIVIFFIIMILNYRVNKFIKKLNQ